MDPNKILKSDYLDILFEGRNKAYGSYELRRNYPKRVGRSIMALGAIALAITAYGVVSNRPVRLAEKPPKPKVADLAVIEPPPIVPNTPPPPPPPEAPPPPAKPTVKFTPPEIKKDEEVREEEKPPEIKELKEATAGTKTVEGDPGGIDPGLIDKPGTGSGPVVPAVVEAPPPPKKDEILTSVEQMPEFNGNVNQYLADNINYPESAREAGIEGRVVIKFVVSEDGSVTNAIVERGVNSALDAEALRVIKKMPKWKPGKQNGQPVKVYYRVPVKFQLE